MSRLSYASYGPRNAEMIRSYQAGLSCADVAKQFNVSRQRVHQVLRSYSITTRSKKESHNVNRK